MSANPFFGNLELTFQCNQDKSAFSPCATGKFCSQCQKPVHDLTRLSDEEITQLIQKNDGGFCGEVYTGQLFYPDRETRKRRTFLDWALAGMTAILITSSPSASAQTVEKVQLEQVMTDTAGFEYCPAPDHLPHARTVEETEEPVRFHRRRFRMRRYVRTTHHFPFIAFGHSRRRGFMRPRTGGLFRSNKNRVKAKF